MNNRMEKRMEKSLPEELEKIKQRFVEGLRFDRDYDEVVELREKLIRQAAATDNRTLYELVVGVLNVSVILMEREGASFGVQYALKNLRLIDLQFNGLLGRP